VESEDEKVINDLVDDMFTYHSWSKDQVEKGNKVKEALAEACKVIYRNVPISSDRSSAIRKLREARMDANSAITHNGIY
jgi:hypothetical protein